MNRKNIAKSQIDEFVFLDELQKIANKDKKWLVKKLYELESNLISTCEDVTRNCNPNNFPLYIFESLISEEENYKKLFNEYDPKRLYKLIIDFEPIRKCVGNLIGIELDDIQISYRIKEINKKDKSGLVASYTTEYMLKNSNNKHSKLKVLHVIIINKNATPNPLTPIHELVHLATKEASYKYRYGKDLKSFTLSEGIAINISYLCMKELRKISEKLYNFALLSKTTEEIEKFLLYLIANGHKDILESYDNPLEDISEYIIFNLTKNKEYRNSLKGFFKYINGYAYVNYLAEKLGPKVFKDMVAGNFEKILKNLQKNY
ncbi:MAG: hypothetical protein QXL82_02135 [Candidatus Aenigmatarchaeota archaeon]